MTTKAEVLSTLELDALDSRKARERFVRHIRDAARAGASTREIASAAGLSHQRVHQIINEKGKAS